MTSVNLTDEALDRNLKIGLLVRDHALAVTMTRHFPTLIERSNFSASHLPRRLDFSTG